MRVAIYFTPEIESPLSIAATQWFALKDLSGLSKHQLQTLLTTPKKYGFHGTIKPPFTLNDGFTLNDLEQELRRFASTKHGVILPGLEVTRLGSFFCLKPIEQSIDLDNFAFTVVKHFDYFRKPATEEELEKRRLVPLTTRQDRLLLQWGYPYVDEEFHFHLTLTGKITSHNHYRNIEQELQKRFDPILSTAVNMNALTICTQENDNPFKEYKRIPLKKPRG